MTDKPELTGSRKSKSQKLSIAMTRHGRSNSREYQSWEGMKYRCNNPNCLHYDNYGGRGIKVCKRWERFESFYADMGERPKGTSIGRIDNDGNYEPGNCRWETREQQGANRRPFRKLPLPDRVWIFSERYFQDSGKTKFPTVRLVARALRVKHHEVEQETEDSELLMLTSYNVVPRPKLAEHFVETFEP